MDTGRKVAIAALLAASALAGATAARVAEARGELRRAGEARGGEEGALQQVQRAGDGAPGRGRYAYLSVPWVPNCMHAWVRYNFIAGGARPAQYNCTTTAATATAAAATATATSKSSDNPYPPGWRERHQ